MTVTISLPSKLARFGLFVGALMFAALLLLVAQTHYVIRALSDNRYRRPANNLSLLRLAANYLPNSARLNLELGRTELTEDPDPQNAINHAALVVDTVPDDYQGWHLLGLAQDAAGNQEAAEQAFAQAVKLAPTNSKVSWAAANVFLRSGKLTETLTAMRTATTNDPSLLPTALDLLWQATGRNVEMLQRLTAGRAEAQLALAQFFAEEALYPEALTAFQSLDREQRLNDPQTTAFLTKMISAKQFQVAQALWLEMFGAQPAAEPRNWLWNGGFEWEAPRGFDQFNWRLGQTEHARLGYDRRVTHAGKNALRIMFTGRDTTTLNGEIEQLLVLRPGAAYQLECYVRTAELLTPEGPQVALFNAGTLLAASEPVAAGTTDWQRLAVNFTAPAEAESLSVRIVRRPKFVYDEPTKGTVWFDDFKLSCTGGC